MGTPDVAAIARVGFVRPVERGTYHKQEKTSEQGGGQGPGKELQDGSTLEDAETKLAIVELGGNDDYGAVGQDEPVKMGGRLAEGGNGRECAPDGRLEIGGEQRGLERGPDPDGDPAEGQADEKREKEGRAGPER